MCSDRQRGFSLIEVVVFIVVLGIGVAGMAVIYNQLTISSVDPMVRKQAVAIANSLMEEIQLRSFTYCDPDDPAVFVANSTADCAPLGVENIGPEAAAPFGPEARSAGARFDNVNDYNGLSLPSIEDAGGSPVNGLVGYSASVAVAEASADFAGVLANEALRITVTVNAPANVRVILQGYRLRYAPKSP